MNGEKHEIVLSFGGNQPQTADCFRKALKLLGQKLGEVTEQSGIYKSEAWGFEKPTSDFLNQVVVINSNEDPHNVFKLTQNIEKQLGRETKSISENYQDRPIDIDILFYSDKIIETKNLTIPHYLIEKRKFILVPLNEILPNFMHPVLKKTLKELLLHCTDKLEVKPENNKN